MPNRAIDHPTAPERAVRACSKRSAVCGSSDACAPVHGGQRQARPDKSCESFFRIETASCATASWWRASSAVQRKRRALFPHRNGQLCGPGSRVESASRIWVFALGGGGDFWVSILFGAEPIRASSTVIDLTVLIVVVKVIMVVVGAIRAVHLPGVRGWRGRAGPRGAGGRRR